MAATIMTMTMAETTWQRRRRDSARPWRQRGSLWGGGVSSCQRVFGARDA